MATLGPALSTLGRQEVVKVFTPQMWLGGQQHHPFLVADEMMAMYGD